MRHHRVDGQHVHRAPISIVAPLLLGDPKTKVTVTFKRSKRAITLDLVSRGGTLCVPFPPHKIAHVNATKMYPRSCKMLCALCVCLRPVRCFSTLFHACSSRTAGSPHPFLVCLCVRTLVSIGDVCMWFRMCLGRFVTSAWWCDWARRWRRECRKGG